MHMLFVKKNLPLHIWDKIIYKFLNKVRREKPDFPCMPIAEHEKPSTYIKILMLNLYDSHDFSLEINTEIKNTQPVEDHLHVEDV